MGEMQVLSDAPSEGSGSEVMGNNLVSFFGNLSREDKRFVKDSMRWAEHRADQLHSRDREPAQWFDFYSGVLWSVGWGLEHEPVIIAEKNYSGDVFEVWEKSMSMLLSRNKRAAMKNTFLLLEHNPLSIDELKNSSLKYSDFRFVPVDCNRYGELEIVISNVRFLSHEWSSNYLFWKIRHTGSQLDIRCRRFVIKPQEINKYREQLSAAVFGMRLKEIELTKEGLVGLSD
jgi:hypothetical protein